MGFVNVARRRPRARLPGARPAARPAPIALVTHSGSVFSALLRTHRRLEYSLAVSSGQELVTTAADYLDYALDLQETARGRACSWRRCATRRALRAALAAAAERDVPVVALAVGGSPTGAVAGHSALGRARRRRRGLGGAVRAHTACTASRDLDELVDTLELFAIGRRVAPPPRAPASPPCTTPARERVLVADVARARRRPVRRAG